MNGRIASESARNIIGAGDLSLPLHQSRICRDNAIQEGRMASIRSRYRPTLDISQ